MGAGAALQAGLEGRACSPGNKTQLRRLQEATPAAEAERGRRPALCTAGHVTSLSRPQRPHLRDRIQAGKANEPPINKGLWEGSQVAFGFHGAPGWTSDDRHRRAGGGR